MRIVLFLLLVICTGALSQAQDIEMKVKTVSMPISHKVYQTKLVKKLPTAVAGIFVIKNSRIKRALSFTIKTKGAKLV